ncbi:GPW/gp25 family protein [Leptolyngbya sp. NK1-12]|uniref:GPW/gp25 family protein n=1 Tax=Leptolyngbya sp. NK1-12 TaxID=2547451 RepID=A0AA97AJG1_9CYAN|nr:GPW/gp25 family protein [Leptolyngbya sp. NK1-12]MBF2050526.1 GPW/gp25 family protein [Elainella sp. C42_A2020_010]RNJ70035.1 MAG: baseplate protein [Leptolyngbya sp. IPPAS B-1204]WNZ27750.1 GPW/gp25 family protein [Leptolyngbya sp. NK1-12]
MAKLFLGRGLGFPIQSIEDGSLQMADYEESVRQSILMILGTAKGERVMRPDFGCDIYNMVFEMQTATTAGRISQAVQDALLKLEPRIDVIDVQTIPESDGDGERLVVNLRYQVRATNNAFNLVYPFYLERSVGA